MRAYFFFLQEGDNLKEEKNTNVKENCLHLGASYSFIFRCKIGSTAFKHFFLLFIYFYAKYRFSEKTAVCPHPRQNY